MDGGSGDQILTSFGEEPGPKTEGTASATGRQAVEEEWEEMIEDDGIKKDLMMVNNEDLNYTTGEYNKKN